MCSADPFETLIRVLKRHKVRHTRSATFAQLTTLGVGGKIRLTIFPDTVRKAVKTLAAIDRLGIRRLVLGKGSNVLASDAPFDGAVVVMCCSGVKIRKNRVTALAGTSTVHLSKVLCEHGLDGGEFFACLPATVGGAVVGNAGCFGQDVHSVLRSVTIYKKGKIAHLGKEKCEFSKRNSVFKRQNEWVVLSARFEFVPSCRSDVEATISQMRRVKAQTQPLNYRSAGCVLFHERAAVSALIDRAGLKGLRIGGAKVSQKHAGFVLNIDKATALDIYLVIQRVKQTLWDKFGVIAETEVRLIGWLNDDIFATRQDGNNAIGT